MERKTYAPETFIGEYIARCESSSVPLDNVQVGLLETSVRKYLMFNSKPTPETIGLTGEYKEIDIPILETACLIHGCKRPSHIVKTIRQNSYGERNNESIKVSDADAIAFYVLVTNEMPPYPPRTVRKYGLGKFTQEGMVALHRYMDVKGHLNKIPVTKGVEKMIAVYNQRNKWIRENSPSRLDCL